MSITVTITWAECIGTCEFSIAASHLYISSIDKKDREWPKYGVSLLLQIFFFYQTATNTRIIKNTIYC